VAVDVAVTVPRLHVIVLPEGGSQLPWLGVTLPKLMRLADGRSSVTVVFVA
jgi:hypothetical protein